VDATVARWLKREGEPVGAGEAVVELETDKINLEVSATTAGILEQIQHPAGEDVKVGEVLGLIGDAKATPPADMPAAQPAQAKDQPAEGRAAANGRAAAPRPASEAPAPRVSSLAQRIAIDQGVDIAQVPGSGPGKRVTKDDVEQFVAQRKAEP